MPIQSHKKRSGYTIPTTYYANEVDSAYGSGSKRVYSIHGIEYHINVEWHVNEAIYIQKSTKFTYINSIISLQSLVS